MIFLIILAVLGVGTTGIAIDNLDDDGEEVGELLVYGLDQETLRETVERRFMSDYKPPLLVVRLADGGTELYAVPTQEEMRMMGRKPPRLTTTAGSGDPSSVASSSEPASPAAAAAAANGQASLRSSVLAVRSAPGAAPTPAQAIEALFSAWGLGGGGAEMGIAGGAGSRSGAGSSGSGGDGDVLARETSSRLALALAAEAAEFEAAAREAAEVAAALAVAEAYDKQQAEEAAGSANDSANGGGGSDGSSAGGSGSMVASSSGGGDSSGGSSGSDGGGSGGRGSSAPRGSAVAAVGPASPFAAGPTGLPRWAEGLLCLRDASHEPFAASGAAPDETAPPPSPLLLPGLRWPGSAAARRRLGSGGPAAGGVWIGAETAEGAEGAGAGVKCGRKKRGSTLSGGGGGGGEAEGTDSAAKDSMAVAQDAEHEAQRALFRASRLAAAAEAAARRDCLLCCDQPACAVFLGCGHGGVCFDCALDTFVRNREECPFCRAHVAQIVTVGPNFTAQPSGLVTVPVTGPSRHPMLAALDAIGFRW